MYNLYIFHENIIYTLHCIQSNQSIRFYSFTNKLPAKEEFNCIVSIFPEKCCNIKLYDISHNKRVSSAWTLFCVAVTCNFIKLNILRDTAAAFPFLPLPNGSCPCGMVWHTGHIIIYRFIWSTARVIVMVGEEWNPEEEKSASHIDI